MKYIPLQFCINYSIILQVGAMEASVTFYFEPARDITFHLFGFITC
ncbi:hypothetical protein COXBURSA334_A0020 [Coxiella burnetii Q321]|nr:hypothetical protein COXBURSA334_A0020 [Coxiella burnetii Q321]